MMQATQILPPPTPVSLLVRLVEKPDNDSWTQFVHLYTPVLLYWAKRNQFQEADAENLVQEVFATLHQKLPLYERREGTLFRSWLFTIAGNKARDFWRNGKVRPLRFTDQLPENGENPFEAMDEKEYRQILLTRALNMVRRESNESTWAAFSSRWLGCRPAKEVATKLETTENAVHMACRRVLKRLRELLDDLWN